MRTNSNKRMQEFFQEKLDELLNVPIDIESSEEIFADVSISDNDDDYIIELKQELDKQLEQLKLFNGWNISTEDDGIHILVVNTTGDIDEYTITIEDEITYHLDRDVQHILENISDEFKDNIIDEEIVDDSSSEENYEVYSSDTLKSLKRPSERKISRLIDKMEKDYDVLLIKTICEEVQDRFQLSEKETFDVMMDYFNHDADSFGAELTCKPVSISKNDKQHYYKDNVGVIDGRAHDGITLAMIKERWNEDCETDPDLLYYESFSDWFNEISADLIDCGSTKKARL